MTLSFNNKPLGESPAELPQIPLAGEMVPPGKEKGKGGEKGRDVEGAWEEEGREMK